MSDETDPSIYELERKRHALFDKLSVRGLSDEEAEPLIAQHEAHEWRIARAGAKDLHELEIKISRLFALLHPMNAPPLRDCLENIMILSILKDVRKLKNIASV